MNVAIGGFSAQAQQGTIIQRLAIVWHPCDGWFASPGGGGGGEGRWLDVNFGPFRFERQLLG